MDELRHIYCDESCHLEHDGQRSMVLGGLSCSATKRRAIAAEMKDLKKRFEIPASREIKWTQISPSNRDFYLALIDMFFDTPALAVRIVVVPEKAELEHSRYFQTHDEFYYKMWYQLLTRMIDSDHTYRIFLDIKDSRSTVKQERLHEVLCNAHYDFDRQRILGVESVRSHEVLHIQLVDVLVGAVSHHFRSQNGSEAKRAVIRRLMERSGLSFKRSTLPRENKFNLFIWQPGTRAR
jgi:hypothetical protein